MLSLDVKRSRPHGVGFVVTTHGGRTETDLDALDWAREAIELGAGELLVNSIDADGTKQGFDLELIRAHARAVSTRARDRLAAVRARSATSPRPIAAGADAVLAASVFHNGELTIGDVKAALAADGRIVR